MRIGIILSGGTGTRIGGDIPKQYIEVGGRTIFSYAAETVAKCVDRIQVVAAEMWRDKIMEDCDGFDKEICFSEPGLTRQFSIYNALKDIEKYASKDDIVLIHDAARPLVTTELIEGCFTAIEKDGHEGALPVIPVKDTVYFSMDGISITSLLDRTKLYAGQAPEAFKFGKYLNANERLIMRTWEAGGDLIVNPASDIFKINGSTEPAKLAGMDVVMVQGDEHNYKITTLEDLGRFTEEMNAGLKNDRYERLIF